MNAGGYLWLFNMYTYTAVAYPTALLLVRFGVDQRGVSLESVAGV